MSDIPVHIREQFGYCFEDIELGMSASWTLLSTPVGKPIELGVSHFDPL